MLGRAVHAAGHLAIWMGLYVASATVCLAQMCGVLDSLMTARGLAALACATLTATGVYLLDRVKLRDAWMDPSDREANPERHTFLRARTRAVRWAVLTLALGGAACGWLVSPLAAAMVPSAFVGIMFYAGRPASWLGRRPKDILLVKNLIVAEAIAAFVLVLLGFLDGLPSLSGRWATFASGFLLLLGRIFADAVLCDIDDAEADRRFGTGTLPVHLGRGTTWGLVIALNLALVLGSWLPAGPGVLVARLYWSVSALATGLALRWWNPRAIRDLIDMRLTLLAVVAVLLRPWLR